MGWDKSKTNPIEWAANMKDVPREAVNIFAFSIFNRVVMKTPVDTGAARQNWLVSINEDDNRVLGTDVKYKKIKRRKGENAGKVEIKRSVKLERSANDTMEQGRMAIAFAQGDDKIIIQNNLPYIKMLEFGGYGKTITTGKIFKRKKFIASNTRNIEAKTGKTIKGFSHQAPQGMVGLTLAKADRLWNAAVKAAMEMKRRDDYVQWWIDNTPEN